MPVDDHPVHESTKIEAGTRYGCHNRQPFAEGYYAPNKTYPFKATQACWKEGYVFIEHRLSTDCRYDISMNDHRCAGCCHVA